MKKPTKIALITASIFILCGLAFCVASLAVSDGDWMAYQNGGSYVRKEQAFEADAISAIRLSELSADVRFEKSVDDDLHITYHESEKVFYDIETASDGTLSVTYRSNRKWYDFIGFHIDSRDHAIVISVPDGFSGIISAKLSSGDLRITGFTLDGSLTAESTSGDVWISDFICTGDMKIQQTSGDFEGQKLAVASLSLTHTSGDIEIDGLEAGGLSLTSVSGDIEVENSNILSDCTLHSTSGELSLSDMQIGGRLTCGSTSGDIEAERISLAEASLSSTSGDIHATILGTSADHRVEAKTTSGRIRIPENGNGARTIQVETTSGNISVYFR